MARNDRVQGNNKCAHIQRTTIIEFEASIKRSGSPIKYQDSSAVESHESATISNPMVYLLDVLSQNTATIALI